MPYTKTSQARIQELDDVKLSLAQLNEIAAMADAVGGDKGWPIAISNFKKHYMIKAGKWVKKGSSVEKELIVEKEANGSYRIVTISTAAFPDQDDETFTVQAMDYEIKEAQRTGDYPEFRMFHNPKLGFGRVEKMTRIGPFAVDSGHSYDDPFSIAICEKVLKSNTGKWRVSRGFYAMKVSGNCPKCESDLVISKQHMIAGFRCPSCQAVHITYKGKLHNVAFLETKTFDVTVTDIPCNTYTGAFAEKVSSNQNVTEAIMQSKEVLIKKLLEAGLTQEEIEPRIKELTDSQLAAIGDDIPTAALLKELDIEVEKEGDGEEETVEIDPTVITAIAKEVSATLPALLKEALEGLEIEVPAPELKEVSDLSAKVDRLQATLDQLLATKKEALRDALEEMPRNGKLRVTRYKAAPPPADDEEEDEEDMEDEEDEEEMPVGKKTSKEVFAGYDGSKAESLTEFMMGGK